MRIFTTIFAVLALSGAAFARAPTLDELPTVQELIRLSEVAMAAARAAEEAASRDSKLERLKEYENGTLSIENWKEIADILRSSKEELKYRQAAADALRGRFRDLEGPTRRDERVLKIKREIARYLLPLMRDTERDPRAWIAGILSDYFPGDFARMPYDPDGAFLDRTNAMRDWSKLLRK